MQLVGFVALYYSYLAEIPKETVGSTAHLCYLVYADGNRVRYRLSKSGTFYRGEKPVVMTPQQYEDSLRELNLVAYMFGKKITNFVDHPFVRPSMNAIAKTYGFAHDPAYSEILTAVLHISGKRINRFTHTHQSTKKGSAASSRSIDH